MREAAQGVRSVVSRWCGTRADGSRSPATRGGRGLARILIAGALLLAGPAAAEYTDDYWVGVTPEVVTPHLNWGRPAAGGTARVLVIAPRWGQRETVELMQRFDLDCRALMVTRSGGVTVEDVEQFDKVLPQPADVVVVGGAPWGLLLIEHRYEILKKVFEGAGLVFVGPPKSEELDQLWAKGPTDRVEAITSGIPWEMLTAFRGKKPEEIVRAGTFGRGRWVALRYKTHSNCQSLTPSLSPWPAAWEYEYYQSLLGKAIAWACRKEAGVTLAEPAPAVLERRALPGSIPLLFRASAARKLVIEPAFHALGPRTGDGRPEMGVTPGKPVPLSLAAGETGVRVPVPLLPAGRYLCNLRLLDDKGGTAAWFSVPVTVTTDIEVASASLERERYEAGELVAGKAALSRPLAQGETLVLRLRDNHGRLLWEERHARGREFPFRCGPVTPLGTNIHFLEAAVGDARGRVTALETEFSVRGRQRPAFHLAIWEEAEVDHVASLWFRRFREMGVDAVYYAAGRGLRAEAARRLAEANLFSAPSFSSHRCIHDPAAPEKMRQAAAEKDAPFARYDVLFHPSGSDVSMGGNCSCEHTLKALREWLRARYPSLDALNQVWQTRFATWDDVVPDTLEKASERRHFASWVEHARFMETSWAALHGAVRDILAAYEKEPLVGQDGYGRLDSRDGADWWKLLGSFGFYNLYTYQDPPQMEITRSLASAFPNVKLRSLYYGSYQGQYGNLRFQRLVPWYALLHDYNGLFWWIAEGKTGFETNGWGKMFCPDFRPTRSFAANKAELDAMRAGPAQWVQGQRRQHNGIAILYDQTAVHAVTAYSHPSRLVAAYGSAQALVEDLGLQYDYLAGAQVEAGALAGGGYKVLILAQALALSDPAVAAIQRFVREGGTLLADAVPGQYDAYLRPATGGSPLAGLFGAPGEMKAIGAGRAVLLGDLLEEYPRRRFEAAGREKRARMEALLRGTGIPRFATLAGLEAKDPGIPGVEVVEYRSGDAHTVALMRDAAGEVKSAVSVPQAFHVYDARQGAYLGHLSRWGVSLGEGDTRLFALLPYRVTGLKAVAAAARRGAACPVTLAVQGPPAGRSAAHALRFEVRDPAGKRRAEYCDVLTTDAQGKVTGSIPFALNDPAGTWTVTVTDVVSGEKAEARIALK